MYEDQRTPEWLRSDALLIRDLRNKDYHEHHAVSKSILDKVAKSPLHAKAYIDGARIEPTAAMRFGTALHTAILEPKVFHDCYKPFSGDRRTKAGKEEYESLIQSGKIIISSEDNDAITSMSDAIRQHPITSELLSDGIAESSIFWNDEETGLECKCRPDWMRQDGIIVDLKTTDNASPEAFIRAITAYRYHVQAAHYLAGTGANRFFFVAVEKTAPFAVAVYELDTISLEVGEMLRRENLNTYRECMSSGKWIGYPEEVSVLTLPAWAFPKSNDEDVEVSYV